MKKILLITCMIAALGAKAATPVATLCHDGEITAYAGEYALYYANEDAQDGDQIYLSPGKFAAPYTIRHAITLIGSGMGDGTATDETATYVEAMEGYTSGIILIVPNEQYMIVEGINFDTPVTFYISSANETMKFQFNRCRFTDVLFGSDNNTPSLNNEAMQKSIANFSDCKIAGKAITAQVRNTFTNCVINQLCGVLISANNCVIYDFDYGYIKTYPTYAFVSYSTFSNCIFINTQLTGTDSPGLYSYYRNTYYNCAEINAFAGMMEGKPSDVPAWHYTSIGDIFADGSSSYSDTATYKLTSDAKAKCLGTDGTEIGIYGGPLPFNTQSLTPQLDVFTISTNTTPDGMLKIDAKAK